MVVHGCWMMGILLRDAQWAPKSCIPDADGIFYCAVGRGAEIGNVESSDLFGYFTPALGAAVAAAFGVPSFAPGPYNALLYTAHVMRALVSTAAANVRVRPWLTYRSLPGSALVNSSFYPVCARARGGLCAVAALHTDQPASRAPTRAPLSLAGDALPCDARGRGRLPADE